MNREQLDAIKQRWQTRYRNVTNANVVAMRDIGRLIADIETNGAPGSSLVMTGDERIRFMNAYRTYLRHCAEADETAEPFDDFVRRMTSDEDV